MPTESRRAHKSILDASACVRRAFDFIVAAALLLAASPLMLVVAALIKLDSPGPVFYTQRRCGLQGRYFNIIKFRTMAVDADAILERILRNSPSLRDEYTTYRKIRHDPRLTRLGRFLRVTSLDELPQLLNVLEGSMSLVGPRPFIPSELATLDVPASVILSVKPGLTGLWQVLYRSASTFDQRIAIECQYIFRRSFAGDLSLLIRTIPAVLVKRRAF